MPVDRPRCWHRPRCSPRSTSAACGPCSDRWAEAGELDGDPDGTRLAFVTGSLSRGRAPGRTADIASGESGIVVGTHALLYEGVDFADLGLVVVDEQHRFGVEQRDALRAKAAHATTRAGDDGDADPAHGRDDGLR